MSTDIVVHSHSLNYNGGVDKHAGGDGHGHGHGHGDEDGAMGWVRKGWDGKATTIPMVIEITKLIILIGNALGHSVKESWNLRVLLSQQTVIQ